MATYIRGNDVANATSYTLYEKKADGVYNPLETKNIIDFEVSAMSLPRGEHLLVVKAKADGYADSEYSNAVSYFSNVAITYTMKDYMVAKNAEVGTYTWDGSTLTVSSSTAYKYVVVPISEIQHLTTLTGNATNKACPVLFLSSATLDTNNVVSAVFGEEQPAILDGEAAKSFYIYDEDIVIPAGATHIAFSDYQNYTKLSTTPDELTALTKVVEV